MMPASKKTNEQITMPKAAEFVDLSPKVQAIIDEEFADFEKYLPSIQDVKVYQRKRKEYWENITARLNEEANNNGRADDSASAGNN